MFETFSCKHYKEGTCCVTAKKEKCTPENIKVCFKKHPDFFQRAIEYE